MNSNITITCGNTTCVANNGFCYEYSAVNQTCICFNQFATYPTNNNIMCNYARKKRLTVFLLELIISFGSGHFYAGNYDMAVPKLFFWFVTYCLCIMLRIAMKSNEDNNTTKLIISLVLFMFCTGMIAWQLGDIILYGTGYYKDGNGIDFLPWNG
jgi:hypothetical protein